MFYSCYTYEKLKNAHKYFDAEKKLLYIPIGNDYPLYQKKYAHHINESLEYALYLLSIDEEKNGQLATEIINEVLKYQYTDKNSPNMGDWPFFAEQFPDGEFSPITDHTTKVGVTLIQLLKNYSDFLGSKLTKKIEKSCFLTVFALMSDYNNQNPMTILYTSYTSALCGEIYDKPEFIKFAEQLMQNLYNSIMYYNSLYEYLDTVNGLFILEIAAYILKDVKNKICLHVCSTITNIIWEEYALHYHCKTKQISGPLSYTNSDFASERLNNFLYNALDGKIELPHNSNLIREITKCPVKFHPYFTGEKNIEFSQKVVSHGITFPHYRASTVTSSYIRPDYTLGSANREFFWNMRRPFIGYFGTSENKFCYKIDVLHDFNSFSSAALHSVQMRGCAMGHITFLTNRGDKHINIDSPNPTIKADDLRIRFSVAGNVDDLKLSHTKNSLEVIYKNVTLSFKIPYIRIDGFEPKCRFSQDDNSAYFDIIIYSGRKKVIDFTKMENAILEFIFLITSTGKKLNMPENSLENGILTSTLKVKKHTLTLETPTKPGYDSLCLTFDRQLVNNTVLEEYVTQINENLENYMFIEKINRQQTIDLPISVFDKEESELNKKIDSVQFQDINSISAVLCEILDTLSSSEYSVTLQKRLAIQIVINLFECAKNIDYRLREILDKKYSDIFRKITVAESFEEINSNIMDMLNIINTGNQSLKDTNTSVIKKVFTLIDENLLNPNLSLDFIADTLGYSTSYLSRLFVKSTGTKYVTYIHEKKIEYAIGQLKTTRKTLKEISEETGYSHPNSFMRVFKKHTGMTISEYMNKEILA